MESVASALRYAQTSASAESRRVSKKILIVDDEPIVRSTIRAMLERRGYITSEAADGVEALEHLSSNAVDMILLDLRMPRKNGIKTLAEIRARCAQVRVITMSGVCEDEGSLDLPLLLRADRVIEKPITPEKLFNAMQLCGL